MVEREKICSCSDSICKHGGKLGGGGGSNLIIDHEGESQGVIGSHDRCLTPPPPPPRLITTYQIEI